MAAVRRNPGLTGVINPIGVHPTYASSVPDVNGVIGEVSGD